MKKVKVRKNKIKGGYADTQTVVAFTFMTFIIAIVIPAKLVMAQAVFSMGNISSAAFDSMANSIAAATAFFLFALGFVSAMLFLGVIWDKFTFPELATLGRRENKRRKPAKRTSRKGGFISLELASMSILSILLIGVISSPVFV